MQESKQEVTKVVSLAIFYQVYPNPFRRFDNQGSVVRSIVSLTSSLRVISLTVLADSIHNILIFFQQKISAYLRITRLKF